MFHVRWRESVSRKLLEECATANPVLLDHILHAMADVESILRNEPEFVGESRESNRRCLIVDPLSVTYKLDVRNRIVTVTHAWVHSARQ